MGQKAADGSFVCSCLDKIEPGEVFFVLRAQDLLAPFVIMVYANLLRLLGRPADKIASAEAIAKMMEAHPKRKMPD